MREDTRSAQMLAKQIVEQGKRIKKLETKPNLAFSSIDNGSLSVTDEEGNITAVIGKQDDGTFTTATTGGPTPPTPSAPVVGSSLGGLSVTWDGQFSEADVQVPKDFQYIEVHASEEEDFQVSDETLAGTINSNTGGTTPLALAYGEWFVCLVAKASSGKTSDPSAVSNGIVEPLVEEVTIANELDRIDQAYDGVITEAGQLSSKLDQAVLDLADSATRFEANDVAVNELKTVTLPQLQADLTAAEAILGPLPESVTAAQQTATDAASAASTANQKALDAAGIANSKGKVLVQSTAPGTADRNTNTLWIDTTGGANTPKRWTTGTTWVAVTDKAATDAAAAAAAAKTVADKATADLAALTTKVGTLETDLNANKTAVATAQTDLATLKNTTIPNLNTDLQGAKTRLDQAESKVATNETAINTAKTDLTTAFGQLGTVDSRITTAKQAAIAAAASDAQTKADAVKVIADQAATDAATAATAAANAAGIANGKGKVLVQSTAPSVADRNAVTLWIDTTGGLNTPKRWATGTTWVAVTDKVATDAASAAAAAQTKANGAQTDATKALSDAAAAQALAGTAKSTADSALTMAGSKSRVYYSMTAPTGTASNGDVWRKVDTSKNVVAEWYWGASGWTSSMVTTEMISNLDAGKLTAGAASIDSAVINKLAVGIATVIELNADRITAGKLTAGQIDTASLAVTLASILQLNASAITAGTIDTARLNVTTLSTAIATIISLDASKITSGTVNTDRLNANEIAAKVATVISLNASRITAGTIATARLDTVAIAAATAAFQTVDVKNLFATSGTMSTAVITKLWTEVVNSRKITTEMLAVGAFDNLIPDPNFTNTGLEWGSADATYSFPTNEGRTGGGALKIATSSVQQGRYSARIPATGEATYRISVWVKASMALPAGALGVYTNIKTTPTSSTGGVTNWLKQSNGAVGSNAIAANTWTQISVTSTIPSTAYDFAVGLFTQTTTGVGTVWWCDPSVTRMSGGELIVDGSVTAQQIKAKTITAAELATNSVTTDALAANSVTAAQLQADAINGKTITGATIVGGTVTGGTGSSQVGYNINLTNDANGAYLGFSTPKSTTPATIRANVEGSGSAPGLSLVSPSENDRAQIRSRMRLVSSTDADPSIETNSTLLFTQTVGNIQFARGGNMWSTENMYVDAGGALTLTGRSSQTDLTLSMDSTPYVQSRSTFNRTYTAASNMYITVNGVFGRATSSRRNKICIEDLPEIDDKLLSLKARTWFDKAESESVAEFYGKQFEGQPLVDNKGMSTVDAPGTLRRIPGMVAEEVQEAGLDQFLHYGPNGEVEGLMYDRLGVALIPVVARQRDRINDLEERLARLEGIVEGSIGA